MGWAKEGDGAEAQQAGKVSDTGVVSDEDIGGGEDRG